MAHFTWHELHTRQPARAARFYRDLLGWDTHDDRWTLGGVDIARVTLSDAPAHVPSHWLPSISAEDVDETATRAQRLGARIRRHDAGREAIIVDPRGALFALRRPAPSSSAFAWDELLTDDPEAATAFYVALLGFTVETIDLGAGARYRVLCSDGRRVAGVIKHPADAHPHWLPYLAVQDVDAATRQAIALGASQVLPPRDQPGFGRWSAIDDPGGAGMCLLRPA